MNVLEEFKSYKRNFIHLSSDTILLIHIFEKDSVHSLEDIVLEDDNETYLKYVTNLYKDSAKQFISQLEGNECDAFIEALRNQCNKYLKKRKRKLKKYENNSNK